MRAQEMERLMTVAGRLTPAQRETLLATLMSGWARCEALDLGTPLARLRHRDKWLLQAQALDQGG